MRIPIDTSTLRFSVAAAPERAARAAGVRAAAAADNSVPSRWRVPLNAREGDGSGGILWVTVVGDLEIEPGASVAVEDLTMQTWKRDGRLRMSLRARAITTEEPPATSTSV